MKRSFVWAGTVLSIVGFVGLFVPMADLLGGISDVIMRIIAGAAIVFAIWIVLLVVSVIVFLRAQCRYANIGYGFGKDRK